jgi:hypothetical protein
MYFGSLGLQASGISKLKLEILEVISPERNLLINLDPK